MGRALHWFQPKQFDDSKCIQTYPTGFELVRPPAPVPGTTQPLFPNWWYPPTSPFDRIPLISRRLYSMDDESFESNGSSDRGTSPGRKELSHARSPGPTPESY